MTDLVLQAAILVLSGASIWMVSRREHWARWGYVVGLASQPFWLYATFASDQWGMFALSLFYVYGFAQGIWNFWLRPMPRPPAGNAEDCAFFKHQAF